MNKQFLQGAKYVCKLKGEKKKFMKKILIPTVSIILLLTAVFSISASASFGGGVNVMTESESLIKTGLFGKKLVFSDTDFKQGLAISDFDSITVTKLPPSTDGTLMLAGRRVGEGTEIRRKNIGALVFIPASRDISKTSFKFTVSPYLDSNEIEFVLKFTDKINYEPKIDDASPTSLLTQRDIAIFGKMNAVDGENDSIDYIVVSYPEHGTLEIINEEKGEFRYTPYLNYVGEDAFSYVARDEWGNFSTLATVNVNVSERLSEVEFEDMRGKPGYNAAVTMAAMGIMSGKIVGDGTYFMPDEEVTRAEFVAMLMKTLGMKADSTLNESYFDDNDKIPKALVSYVATAQRAGLILGEFESGKLLFKPNEAITSYEAASIISKALGEKAELKAPNTESSELPVWSRDGVYAMCSLGIFDMEFEEVLKSDTVTKGECAEYLYKIAKM